MDNFFLFLSSSSNQPYLYLLLVADLTLRGFSLYKSARKEQKMWFVALLVINSLGILPLIYLLLQKKDERKPVKKSTRRK